MQDFNEMFKKWFKDRTDKMIEDDKKLRSCTSALDRNLNGPIITCCYNPKHKLSNSTRFCENCGSTIY